MKRIFREPDELEVWLHPNLGDKPRNAREAAIVDVLCRIPDLDYWKLTNRLTRYSWFAPDENASTFFISFDALGEISMRVGDIEGPVAKISHVIYLSPSLESVSPDLLHCLVADKLAHLLLDHDTIISAQDEAATIQSEERFQKLCQWGLRDETIACRSWTKDWARIE